MADRPFHGFFQTFAYSIWERRSGLPTLVPVTEMQVKSQIARPALHEVVPKSAKYTMYGAAWAGESEVTKVEVSTDGGNTWSKAKLAEKSVPFAWRFWEHEWETPSRAGRYTVMARATDERGRVQPMERDKDCRDAVISHVQPIEAYVR